MRHRVCVPRSGISAKDERSAAADGVKLWFKRNLAHTVGDCIAGNGRALSVTTAIAMARGY